VFPEISAARLTHATDDQYRAAGLSRPKIATFRSLADAMGAGLDLVAGVHDPVGLRAAMLAVKGIGPWTVDLYELECLGLADSFPAADLALQESLRLLEGTEQRLDAKNFIARAEPWRPYRAVAARLLWHGYRSLKA
jgi:DNA-3-methyladenine glycosylase II